MSSGFLVEVLAMSMIINGLQIQKQKIRYYAPKTITENKENNELNKYIYACP
jgi:hypothetical protein